MVAGEEERVPERARREAVEPPGVAVVTEGPRRAALLQVRSRRTRHELVRAALALWSERGFERGVEETTVEEIARAAGVTKGTFYFHFAHKEDILLELGWGTAEALYELASEGAASDQPAGAVLDRVLELLSRRVESVPRVAVARAVAEFYRQGYPKAEGHHFGIRRSFKVTMELALGQGRLPPEADTEELAAMLEAVSMEALLRWASTPREVTLLEVLRHRSAVIARGAGWPDLDAGRTPRLRPAPGLREGGA